MSKKLNHGQRRRVEVRSQQRGRASSGLAAELTLIAGDEERAAREAYICQLAFGQRKHRALTSKEEVLEYIRRFRHVGSKRRVPSMPTCWGL